MELRKELLTFSRLRNTPWTAPNPVPTLVLGALAVLAVGSGVAHFIHSGF